MTETLSVMAMISRSLWVIKITVLPWARRVSSTRNRSVGFLGRQNAGRFVQNKGFGAAIERLEDFHALLLAHRDILDDGIGIDMQVIFIGEALELLAAARQAGAEQARILGAEHDVLEHTEIVDEHEVLVHHADAERQGMAAVGDGVFGAIDADDAAIGGVEAIKDRHQGRFARAVLPHDAVDGAALDGEIDVPIGVNRAEPLVDLFKLDRPAIGRCGCSGR